MRGRLVMSFETSADDFDNDTSGDGVELDEVDLDAQEPAGIIEDEANINVDVKTKEKGNEHALEVRRAIEDHLERTRLQKELDYLFDDQFVDED